MGGQELERAVLSFADRGIGDRNLATLLRVDSGFDEESLRWIEIIDRKTGWKLRRKTKRLLFTVWLWNYIQTKVMCLHLTHANGKLRGTIPTNTQAQGLRFLPPRSIN